VFPVPAVPTARAVGQSGRGGKRLGATSPATRAEQHDLPDAIAMDAIKCRAEAFQDRIIGGPAGHDGYSAYCAQPTASSRTMRGGDAALALRLRTCTIRPPQRSEKT
jgi:hypothetical protein